MYKHNFTNPNEKFVLSLHYNGDNSYLFVKGGEELKFKTKKFTDQVKQNLFCTVNLDFAVDYETISSVRTIYDIHRYLMKKHNIT